MKILLINIARLAFIAGLLAPSFGHAVGVATSECKNKVIQQCMSAKTGKDGGTATTGVNVKIGEGAGGSVTGVVNVTQTCENLANATCSSSATASPSLSLDIPIPGM